jgi:S-DNA-T family DNA segregation ATPase FtsK/SpoIIIE
MAKLKSKTSTRQRMRTSFQLSKKNTVILGAALFLFAIVLSISFLSYFSNWQTDQSIVDLF